LENAGELAAQGPGLDMPLREAMSTQRAIRRVKSDPVDLDLIRQCLELAVRAPTGGNEQNWEFIVITDPKVKRKPSAHTDLSPAANATATKRCRRSSTLSKRRSNTSMTSQ
jgi:nitroreductase